LLSLLGPLGSSWSTGAVVTLTIVSLGCCSRWAQQLLQVFAQGMNELNIMSRILKIGPEDCSKQLPLPKVTLQTRWPGESRNLHCSPLFGGRNNFFHANFSFFGERGDGTRVWTQGLHAC
jgi:hypothetical protein